MAEHNIKTVKAGSVSIFAVSFFIIDMLLVSALMSGSSAACMPAGSRLIFILMAQAQAFLIALIFSGSELKTEALLSAAFLALQTVTADLRMAGNSHSFTELVLFAVASAALLYYIMSGHSLLLLSVVFLFVVFCRNEVFLVIPAYMAYIFPECFVKDEKMRKDERHGWRSVFGFFDSGTGPVVCIVIGIYIFALVAFKTVRPVAFTRPDTMAVRNAGLACFFQLPVFAAGLIQLISGIAGTKNRRKRVERLLCVFLPFVLAGIYLLLLSIPKMAPDINNSFAAWCCALLPAASSRLFLVRDAGDQLSDGGETDNFIYRHSRAIFGLLLIWAYIVIKYAI